VCIVVVTPRALLAGGRMNRLPLELPEVFLAGAASTRDRIASSTAGVIPRYALTSMPKKCPPVSWTHA
jgi:hypothetical protein